MRRLTVPGLAAVFGAAMLAGAAWPGTATLGTSGWSATWPSFLDPVLAISVDAQTCDTVFLEKKVTVTSDRLNTDGPFIEPIPIVFQQTSANAVPFIAIDDEQVINQSGLPWTAFTFTLLSAKFDAVRTGGFGESGFSIDPFTTGAYSNGDSVLTVSGGTVSSDAPNNVWLPGSKSGALFVISAPASNGDGLTAFSFKEQPIPIPLPAAWLMTTVGLATLGTGAALKRRLL